MRVRKRNLLNVVITTMLEGDLIMQGYFHPKLEVPRLTYVSRPEIEPWSPWWEASTVAKSYSNRVFQISRIFCGGSSRIIYSSIIIDAPIHWCCFNRNKIALLCLLLNKSTIKFLRLSGNRNKIFTG